MNLPSRWDVIEAIAAAGHPTPERPAVFAFRDAASPDSWNDAIGVIGPDLFMVVAGTTDPGRAPMDGTGRIPVNAKGVARVQPGFYRDAFTAGYHGNGGTNRRHPALRQSSRCPFHVERWNGATWQESAPVVGPYNLHRARWSGLAPVVGDYSHGCLVVRDRLEHWHLLLAAGYPQHGPETSAHYALRWDLYLMEHTP